jgi:hypothetical protein
MARCDTVSADVSLMVKTIGLFKLLESESLYALLSAAEIYDLMIRRGARRRQPVENDADRNNRLKTTQTTG